MPAQMLVLEVAFVHPKVTSYPGLLGTEGIPRMWATQVLGLGKSWQNQEEPVISMRADSFTNLLREVVAQAPKMCQNVWLTLCINPI